MTNQPKKQTEKLHASCVAINSKGVLLLGKSGSGKSDLALRLMARGAMLVADDQVLLSHHNGHLVASVDDSIRGLLEIRGIGLVKYPVATNIPIALAVELVRREDMEHIPAPATWESLGVKVPKIAINGFDSSSPDKIYAAIHALKRDRLHTGFLPDGKES